MIGPNLKGDIIEVPDCPSCGGWVWVVGRRRWCMKPYAAGGCGDDAVRTQPATPPAEMPDTQKGLNPPPTTATGSELVLPLVDQQRRNNPP